MGKKGETLGDEKICIWCGCTFRGIYTAMTCSPKCRVRMNRYIKKGIIPKFYLTAMKNQQKVPKLPFQVGEAKAIAEPSKTEPEQTLPYYLRRLSMKNN